MLYCTYMAYKVQEKKPRKVFVYAVIAVVAAGLIGFFVGQKTAPVVVSTTQSLRENNDAYKFIHPLLAVNRVDMDTPSPTYTNLSKTVSQFIDTEKSSGSLSDASVYFIDYKNNGGSFAINENDAYAPASLLKVVVMIGFLKESDSDNTLLSRQLVYNSSFSHLIDDIPFEMPSLLKTGESYTIGDLIHRMIVDSDNGAMYLLLDNIDNNYLSQVYTQLGLHIPTVDNPNYTISAKDYSLFFRILYNSTYLSRESSETALSYLSQVTFKDGLVAGLPAGTVVAHKYGEHVNGTDGNVDSVELHDCGYVYAPDAPYLLCVMTKSKTLDESQKVISTISKIIYNGR